MLGMADFSSTESEGVQQREVESEDSDDGLDSCVARGGKIVTQPDGSKKCVFKKDTGREQPWSDRERALDPNQKGWVAKGGGFTDNWNEAAGE
jgi:hypothetical protein